jgi:hypothetical protein
MALLKGTLDSTNFASGMGHWHRLDGGTRDACLGPGRDDRLPADVATGPYWASRP